MWTRCPRQICKPPLRGRGLRTRLSFLILLPSVVLDVEERVRREDVGLVLRDEHGGHPPDEELAALEGQRATEVRPLLVSHHALKHEMPLITRRPPCFFGSKVEEPGHYPICSEV